MYTIPVDCYDSKSTLYFSYKYYTLPSPFVYIISNSIHPKLSLSLVHIISSKCNSISSVSIGISSKFVIVTLSGL